ncbi:MAG TPA: hypothetical protein VKA44_04030 [Gemmatimonadota bacterium]|nr:hypothetical protein [Gemmatimonadota bacterium]
MRMYRAYCSACDRPVRVIPLSEFPEDVRPEHVSESSVVCLDYGEECTGALCPLFEVPTSEMRELYERARAGESGDAA